MNDLLNQITNALNSLISGFKPKQQKTNQVNETNIQNELPDPLEVQKQTTENPLKDSIADTIVKKTYGKKLSPNVIFYSLFGLLLIGGVIASTASNEPREVEATPTPTPVPTLPPNISDEKPVAEKTFISTKYNFSFTHPGLSSDCCYISGPALGQEESIGNLSDPATVSRGSDKPFDGLSLYIIDPGDLSADDYMKQESNALIENYIKDHGEEPANSAWQTLTVSSQSAVLLKNYSSLTVNRYYIQMPDTNKILYIGASEARLGSFDHSLNKILSSFNFEN